MECAEFIAIDVRALGAGVAAKKHRISVPHAYNIAKQFDYEYGALKSTRTMRKQLREDTQRYFKEHETQVAVAKYAFRPVTIVLETQREYDQLHDILRSVSTGKTNEPSTVLSAKEIWGRLLEATEL